MSWNHELHRKHATEGEELEQRLAQAQARAEELKITLERERAELTARIADLEQRLEEAAAEPTQNHIDGRELARSERLEALEEELRRVRKVAAAESDRRRLAEQRLDQRNSRRPNAPVSHWWRRARPPCAVCHRPREGASDQELTASGWTLTAAGALCSVCRHDGWQFPPDAKVPFRRVDPPSSR
jgi:DNA repair exonuclease SbcCD ATPase subunit